MDGYVKSQQGSQYGYSPVNLVIYLHQIGVVREQPPVQPGKGMVKVHVRLRMMTGMAPR